MTFHEGQQDRGVDDTKHVPIEQIHMGQFRTWKNYVIEYRPDLPGRWIIGLWQTVAVLRR